MVSGEGKGEGWCGDVVEGEQELEGMGMGTAGEFQKILKPSKGR